MSNRTVYNENEVLAVLIDKVKASSQTKVAKDFGMSVSFINDVLQGRRPVTKRLAQKLGYELQIEKVFTRKYFSLSA